jgi:hypothetical protein
MLERQPHQSQRKITFALNPSGSIGLVILVVAILLLLGRNGRDKLTDITNLNLADAGFAPIEPSQDPKTGFIVGGTNSTTVIKNLTEINGKPIAALQAAMRPGADSIAGFLGHDESLVDVLAEDNEFVLRDVNLTHQELAKHLNVIIAAYYVLGREFEVRYHGRTFKAKIEQYMGNQESPFGDGELSGAEITIRNRSNGKELWFSALLPSMIERYGFYEGKGTRYRLDPRDIIEVFDFLNVAPQELDR